MPITQDRLIDLIELSETCLKKLDDFNSSEFLDNLFLALQRKDLVLAMQIAQELKIYIREHVSPPPDLYRVLMREKEHFRYSARRNTNNRNTLRTMRALKLSRAIDLDEDRAALRELSELDQPKTHPPGSCTRCHYTEFTNKVCDQCGFPQPSSGEAK